MVFDELNGIKEGTYDGKVMNAALGR